MTRKLWEAKDRSKVKRCHNDLGHIVERGVQALKFTLGKNWKDFVANCLYCQERKEKEIM